MTEDEEWQAKETYLQMQERIKARKEAVDAADRLCKRYQDAIAHFSLRKAFELGYLEAKQHEPF